MRRWFDSLIMGGLEMTWQSTWYSGDLVSRPELSHLGILMTLATCQASWRLRTIPSYDCCCQLCPRVFPSDGLALGSTANRT